MPATLPSLLDAALGYAGRGWAVFPVHGWTGERCTCGRAECDSPAKHPHTKEGLHDASIGAEQIRAWWKRWPDANVAVATGEISGMVVIDVDGTAGEATLEQLEAEHGMLPDTARAITGGDGLHYLFRHPGERVRNSAKKKLGPGLDVRGDGGYIVVAPSLHRSGNRYEWLDDTELAEMPAWLLERLRDPVAPRPAERPAPVERRDGGGTPYGLEAMAKELEELRQCQQGGRNDRLNQAAFSLGQLVAGGELDEGLVAGELERIALGIGLGAREVANTIASGLEGGKREPRRAPGPRQRWGSPGTSSDPPRPSHGTEPQPATGGPAGGVDVEERDDDGPEHHKTDLGNARRLVEAHGRDLRYCHAWSTWLVWDGRRWQRDQTGEIFRRAKDTIGRIYARAVSLPSDDRKALIKHALASENSRRIEAMVTLARSEKGIPVVPERLDANPWLLNVMNGTIDLRTGELRPHDPRDGISRLVPVAYYPDAKAPQWERFVDEVLAGNEELVGYLRRAIGYALTGDVSEQCLFFLYGSGANGKSTLLTTLLTLLGDYGKQTEPDLLMMRYGDVHPTGMADLMGARLAVAVEVEQGRRLAESLVKQLTGGDRIKARFMRQDFFEFAPTHKLFLAANHKPVVKGTDAAIWRRIRLVPFTVAFAPEQQDRGLVDRLRGELPGILAWAVRGCLEWQRDGLGAPAEVVKATSGYRSEMDTIGQFIEERCELGEDLWATAADLRKAYTDWCEELGERPENAKVFGGALAERGFERQRNRSNRRWEWHGIGLATTPSIFATHRDPSRPVSGDDASRARGSASSAKKGRMGRDGSRGDDEPRQTEVDGDGWTWFDKAIGGCVVCDTPCRSTDTEGRPRHPFCAIGGTF